MNNTKLKILDRLAKSQGRSEVLRASLHDRVSLLGYERLVRIKDGLEIWTDALQTALDEYEVVDIPARQEPYYIDGQIIIGSNRRIEASGAVIRQTPGFDLLMLRNANTIDGTHAPIQGDGNVNISVNGGRWEESRSKRGSYGSSGKYDESRSFYGVSTLFFFNNVENLSLTNVTFAHTAGFAVQVGNIHDALFEHIRFEECYADGLHINGNTENLICRDISGEVGDDLVALNMYDWQDSSVNFGPTKTVLCEGLHMSETSRYKALRIEPGRYYYADGSDVDCSLTDAVFSDISGVRTFKLYFQTPRYRIGENPERGDVGSADNLFFENIMVDLCAPIDGFDAYNNSDPVRGSFAAFELGANIGNINFKNIDVKLYKDKYPYSYLVCCGPKSVLSGEFEIFDPYLSSSVGRLTLEDIKVNGIPFDTDTGEIVREIEFNDVNGDGHSTGSGKIHEIYLNGTKVK